VSSVFAFIDESGDPNLDTSKQGTSKFFIVCAVIVKEDGLAALKAGAELIRGRYFQTGEIKSSGIKGSNHGRRVKILNEMFKLDFKFYAVAVDKGAVRRDSGLKHKKSFLKYVNGLLYSRLFQNYEDLYIVADEHGSDDFKTSFQSYINKQHKPDLFWRSRFDLVSSKDDVLVQLSDFVVGTLAKIYEGKGGDALAEAYQKLIKDKSLGLVEWPTKYQTYFPRDTTTPGFDEFIHKHALNKAEVFLESNENSAGEDVMLQVCVLAYLVFQSRMVPFKNYVPTKELLIHLNERGFLNVKEQAIRSTIIAKLRDKEVIIASCNKGYKIPCCYDDLYDFVERVDSQVMPLLKRLNRARNSYLLASHNEIDLLKGPNYPKLVSFLEEFNK